MYAFGLVFGTFEVRFWFKSTCHEFLVWITQALISSDDSVSGQPVHWVGNKSVWSEEDSERGNRYCGAGSSRLRLPGFPPKRPPLSSPLHGTKVVCERKSMT